MTQTQTLGQEETTIIEESKPKKIIRTTRMAEPSVKTEHPQKVFEKKKTIFRFYQAVWYILALVEFLLGFRFFLKALGANQFSGFTTFIYAITQPLSSPFQGIFRTDVNPPYVFEWSTLFAMVVYAIVAYGIVYLVQFLKPVSKEEVEESVDE